MPSDTFASFAALRDAIRDLPATDAAAAAGAAERQAQLTKPEGSLGALETLVAWLAAWQGRPMPRLDTVTVIVFAGNHGVTAQGVSAYPAAVTEQMVANFAAGGAAINQLAKAVDATLDVIPLDLDRPTGDFTRGPAMTERDFLDAALVGFEAVAPDADLICLGEMGIGNTTAAAAIAAAMFGGGGAKWAGRGTGLDDAGVAQKAKVIDAGLARHPEALADPLQAAACLGGRELAAILGATLAARRERIPVLLDGFVCTAAAAPLHAARAGGLDHAQVAHRSAEAGHDALIAALGKTPLLDLGMRLGEASGAALAVAILRAAVACHAGMATFADAGVDNKA
jgi:nicotinate-nucleotide--dimethylbenzimidazole phosphoribosyltransferase